jgi:hypothetical protein
MKLVFRGRPSRLEANVSVRSERNAARHSQNEIESDFEVFAAHLICAISSLGGKEENPAVSRAHESWSSFAEHMRRDKNETRPSAVLRKSSAHNQVELSGLIAE